MKRILWICLVILLTALPAAAQESDWVLDFFEDFDDNSFAWPLGTESRGGMVITRTIRNSNYVWSLSTSDPNFTWMG